MFTYARLWTQLWFYSIFITEYWFKWFFPVNCNPSPAGWSWRATPPCKRSQCIVTPIGWPFSEWLALARARLQNLKKFLEKHNFFLNICSLVFLFKKSKKSSLLKAKFVNKRFYCLNPRRSPRPGQIPLIETRSEKPPEVKTQEGYMY